MGNRKKKGESGEVKRYITRNGAVKKLQLSLRDFRRLCILKGVYPREPKSRKKVQKGSSEYKTLYYMKDIRYLMHEPIIWKFREHRSVMLKVKKAYAKNDKRKGGSLFSKRPFYRLNHIVRERYPTFTDALRDLDDPLTLCSLFAKMSKLRNLKFGMLDVSRRMITEFMLYVIEARALRKVFISIKGYYYQADIFGQTITWITPHPFTPQNSTKVDLEIMRTFQEFYLSLIGFVNYRLFTNLGLHYPPQLRTPPNKNKSSKGSDTDQVVRQNDLKQRITSLNFPLLRKNKKLLEPVEEVPIDTHILDDEKDELIVMEAREEEHKVKYQQNMFSGLKFFLNRETNLESLTFVIRSCGGEVSWDEITNAGSTFQENNETITHQIIDRPTVQQTYLSRYYVQPQWVYDCINARLLLPVQDYFHGAKLPPHLSPFDMENDLYMPPEKKQLLARQRGEIPEEEMQNPVEETDSENEEELEKPKLTASMKAKIKLQKRREKRILRAKEEATTIEARKKAAGNRDVDERSEVGEEINIKENEDASNKNELDGKDTTTKEVVDKNCRVNEGGGRGQKKQKVKEPVEMGVIKGKTVPLNISRIQQKKREDLRLNEMMIPKKRKKVYKMLVRKEKKQQKQAEYLKHKRAVIDYKEKKEKRSARKQQQENEMANGRIG